MEWKPAKKLGRTIRKNMAENSKFLDGQLCLMLTGIGGCWAVLRSLTGKQEGGYVRNLVNPVKKITVNLAVIYISKLPPVFVFSVC